MVDIEADTPKFEEVSNNPKKRINNFGSVTISTTVGVTLWQKAKNHNISWSEAMRVGLSNILSEKGDESFINPKQQQIKIEKLVNKLEELAEENLRYQEEIKKMRGKV